MPRRKKSTTSQTPSSSFLGEDPVFEEDEEDDEVAAPVSMEKSALVVHVAPPLPPRPLPPPAPTWDMPVTVHDVDHPLLNKPGVIFSHAQFAALLDYLVESRTTLSDEKRRAFDEGHMGQIMKNLRG